MYGRKCVWVQFIEDLVIRRFRDCTGLKNALDAWYFVRKWRGMKEFEKNGENLIRAERI